MIEKMSTMSAAELKKIAKVKKNRTAGDWLIIVLLIIGGLVMLFPFVVLCLNAFKTSADYNANGPLSWPASFTLDGFIKFWTRVNFPEKVWNSIWTSGLVAIFAWCCPCSTPSPSASAESRAVAGSFC